MTELTAGTTDDGVWVAYHSDYSGFAVFPSELEALRHAVANLMSVTHLPYGVDLGEHVNADQKQIRIPPTVGTT